MSRLVNACCGIAEALPSPSSLFLSLSVPPSPSTFPPVAPFIPTPRVTSLLPIFLRRRRRLLLLSPRTRGRAFSPGSFFIFLASADGPYLGRHGCCCDGEAGLPRVPCRPFTQGAEKKGKKKNDDDASARKGRRYTAMVGTEIITRGWPASLFFLHSFLFFKLSFARCVGAKGPRLRRWRVTELKPLVLLLWR